MEIQKINIIEINNLTKNKYLTLEYIIIMQDTKQKKMKIKGVSYLVINNINTNKNINNNKSDNDEKNEDDEKITSQSNQRTQKIKENIQSQPNLNTTINNKPTFKSESPNRFLQDRQYNDFKAPVRFTDLNNKIERTNNLKLSDPLTTSRLIFSPEPIRNKISNKPLSISSKNSFVGSESIPLSNKPFLGSTAGIIKNDPSSFVASNLGSLGFYTQGQSEPEDDQTRNNPELETLIKQSDDEDFYNLPKTQKSFFDGDDDNISLFTGDTSENNFINSSNNSRFSGSANIFNSKTSEKNDDDSFINRTINKPIYEQDFKTDNTNIIESEDDNQEETQQQDDNQDEEQQKDEEQQDEQQDEEQQDEEQQYKSINQPVDNIFTSDPKPTDNIFTSETADTFNNTELLKPVTTEFIDSLFNLEELKELENIKEVNKWLDIALNKEGAAKEKAKNEMIRQQLKAEKLKAATQLDEPETEPEKQDEPEQEPETEPEKQDEPEKEKMSDIDNIPELEPQLNDKDYEIIKKLENNESYLSDDEISLINKIREIDADRQQDEINKNFVDDNINIFDSMNVFNPLDTKKDIDDLDLISVKSIISQANNRFENYKKLEFNIMNTEDEDLKKILTDMISEKIRLDNIKNSEVKNFIVKQLEFIKSEDFKTFNKEIQDYTNKSILTDKHLKFYKLIHSNFKLGRGNPPNYDYTRKKMIRLIDDINIKVEKNNNDKILNEEEIIKQLTAMKKEQMKKELKKDEIKKLDQIKEEGNNDLEQGEKYLLPSLEKKKSKKAVEDLKKRINKGFVV